MKLLSKTIITFFLVATPLVATADLNDVMQSIINQHTVNTTAASSGEIELMGMGYLSGGSIELRRKVTTPTVIKFDPPRAKAGCNGWSLFGGSLSYIKLDQFVEYVREVLTNSAGYLFEIALKAICSTCAQTMDLLRQGADAVNNMMRDSCTTSRVLAGAAGAKITDANNSLVDMGAINGHLERWIGAFEEGVSSFYELQQQANVGGNPLAQQMLQETEGNMVFKALNKSELITTLFPELHLKNSVDHSEFRKVVEEIQSITGTIVAEIQDQKPVNGGGTNPDPKASDLKLVYVGNPNLDFETLFKGEKTTLETAPQDVDILGCLEKKEDDPFCKKVGRISRGVGSVAGLLSKFEEVVIGNDTRIGILQKMELPHVYTTLSQDERAFLATSSIGVQTIMKNVANKGTAGEVIGKHIARIAAVDRFKEFMDQLLQIVEASVRQKGDLSNDNQTHFAAFRERMRHLQDELWKWVNQNNEELKQHTEIQEMYLNIMKTTSGDNRWQPITARTK